MIDSDLKLTNFLERLHATPWIALDTEADSLHAYPEKICLLQISTPSGDDLIDPLAGMSIDPLLRALDKHELIMHGADYDLRLLSKHHQFAPSAIFDTMLAGRLLGQTQFGLTHLAAHYLGVTLEKGSQKADWAQRPLTERMETYARNDTRHLKPLADRLKTELEAKARLSWQMESCARLIRDCAQSRPADPDLVWRAKGSQRLSRRALAVLRELWRWREKEAIAANRPPYFVLSHELLIELAAGAAAGQEIEAMAPQRMASRRRLGLLQAVKEGMAIPPQNQPEPLKHVFRRVTDAVKRRAMDLQRHRDARASELGIDPTLIASRAILLDLAEDWTKHEGELMNWQRELLKK